MVEVMKANLCAFIFDFLVVVVSLFSVFDLYRDIYMIRSIFIKSNFVVSWPCVVEPLYQIESVNQKYLKDAFLDLFLKVNISLLVYIVPLMKKQRLIKLLRSTTNKQRMYTDAQLDKVSLKSFCSIQKAANNITQLGNMVNNNTKVKKTGYSRDFSLFSFFCICCFSTGLQKLKPCGGTCSHFDILLNLSGS